MPSESLRSRAALRLVIFMLCRVGQLGGIREIEIGTSVKQWHETSQLVSRLRKREHVPPVLASGLLSSQSWSNVSSEFEVDVSAVPIPYTRALRNLAEKYPLRRCLANKLSKFIRFLDRKIEYYGAAVNLAERATASPTPNAKVDAMNSRIAGGLEEVLCLNKATWWECVTMSQPDIWLQLIHDYEDARTNPMPSDNDKAADGEIQREVKIKILTSALTESGFKMDKAVHVCEKEALKPDPIEQRACMTAAFERLYSGEKAKEINKDTRCPNDTGGKCRLFCWKSYGPTKCMKKRCRCSPGYCFNKQSKKCEIDGEDEYSILQLGNRKHSLSNASVLKRSSFTSLGIAMRHQDTRNIETCPLKTRGTCFVTGCLTKWGPTECIKRHCYCRPGFCAHNGVCELADSVQQIIQKVWDIKDRLKIVKDVAHEGSFWRSADCAFDDPEVRNDKAVLKELMDYQVGNGHGRLRDFLKKLQHDVCGHVTSASELGLTLKRAIMETASVCKWDRSRSCKNKGQCVELDPARYCAEGHQCTCSRKETPERFATAFMAGTALGTIGTWSLLGTSAVLMSAGAGPAGAAFTAAAGIWMPIPDVLLGVAVALPFMYQWSPTCSCSALRCTMDRNSNRCVMKKTGGADSSNPFVIYPPAGMKCVAKKRGEMIKTDSEDLMERAQDKMDRIGSQMRQWGKELCQLVGCGVLDIQEEGPKTGDNQQLYGKVGRYGKDLYNCANTEQKLESGLAYLNKLPAPNKAGKVPNTPKWRRAILQLYANAKPEEEDPYVNEA